MASAFSKSSVLVCPHAHEKTAFKSSTSERVLKSSVFSNRCHQIRVDRSRIRTFSNENGYVWTEHKIIESNIRCPG